MIDYKGPLANIKLYQMHTELFLTPFRLIREFDDKEDTAPSWESKPYE